MIDVGARRRLAEAARALVAGRITNDEFESRIPETEVGAVSEVYSRGFWVLYGDLFEHKLIGKRGLTPEQRHFAALCIMFLKSDEEYSYPRHNGFRGLFSALLGIFSLGFIPWLLNEVEQPSHWPFASASALEKALQNPVYLCGVV